MAIKRSFSSSRKIASVVDDPKRQKKEEEEICKKIQCSSPATDHQEAAFRLMQETDAYYCGLIRPIKTREISFVAGVGAMRRRLTTKLQKQEREQSQNITLGRASAICKISHTLEVLNQGSGDGESGGEAETYRFLTLVSKIMQRSSREYLQCPPASCIGPHQVASGRVLHGASLNIVVLSDLDIKLQMNSFTSK
ncbi:hypothetical protein H6P81_007595 [Aristolochia fimbriata]|uniref:Uncharacterized protein n=1 Tax=Aristolochia fimbriata TaxID=158543 RepID=A0AAV7F3I8_ARIFI|nr:hypothetical protein H6P81_007595 [Aristolochia fimbriata]